MLRTLLAGLAIASLLVGLIVLLIWWRSFKHDEQFTMGDPASTQTTFLARQGRVAVTTRENLGQMIDVRVEFYRFSQVLWGCLVIPGFWLAIWVRSKLPRPGGRPSELERRSRWQR